MKLTVIGSGTLWPDGERSSAAHFVETGACRVLLDCGSGTVHAMGRLDLAWQKITHIAITHFHTDHVGDLPALFWAFRVGLRGERREPLVLLGPPGIRRFMERLARAFGEFILDPQFPVHVVELAREDQWQDPARPLSFSTKPTVHTARSLAYRLTADATVGYTGDTGPDQALFEFFAGVDAVVAECSEADPPSAATHLSPAGVAELGRVANPGVIITTHVYHPLEPSKVPGLVKAAGWTGPVLAGHDGLTIQIPFANGG